MTRTQIIDEELNAVAAYLRERRPAILDAWRAAANADPQLTTSNSLPRSQFNDHIPDVLDNVERRLQAWPAEPQRLDAQQKKHAASHGLQRWQQGYRLREVTREWGHLQLVLLDELENYAKTHTHHAPEAMQIARRVLSELCAESVSDSVSEYFELEKLEAEGHVRDLARALERRAQAATRPLGALASGRTRLARPRWCGDECDNRTQLDCGVGRDSREVFVAAAKKHVIAAQDA